MKKILLTGLAALAVFAYGCSDKTDDFKPEIDNAGNVNGYVTLSIDGPKLSRTLGTPTDAGETNESEIANAIIVFTDAAGKITASTSDLSLTNGQTEPIKIAVGQHYVYALVNVTGITMNITADQNIQQLITVADAAEATSGYKGGSFFMTNQRHNFDDVAGVPVTVTAQHTVNTPAQAIINVDRVAVKIVDKTGTPEISGLTTNSGGIVTGATVEGFVVLNVNRQFNLIQDWNMLNGSGPALTENVLSTPIFGQPGSIVGTGLVAEQYFHNISDYAELSSTAIVDKIKTKTIPVTKTVYATENRPTMTFFGTAPQKPTAGQGETTGVIYRVQTTPATTFYAYKGTAYPDLTFAQSFPELKDLTLPTEASELRTLGIRVYENGVMYYSYFIKDPNENYRYNNNDYYGVFRNSIYDLNITKLTKLGDDVPGGGRVDPTKPGEPENPPIDTTDAYVQVTVTINPWILNTIDIEF